MQGSQLSHGGVKYGSVSAGSNGGQGEARSDTRRLKEWPVVDRKWEKRDMDNRHMRLVGHVSGLCVGKYESSFFHAVRLVNHKT